MFASFCYNLDTVDVSRSRNKILSFSLFLLITSSVSVPFEKTLLCKQTQKKSTTEVRNLSTKRKICILDKCSTTRMTKVNRHNTKK